MTEKNETRRASGCRRVFNALQLSALLLLLQFGSVLGKLILLSDIIHEISSLLLPGAGSVTQMEKWGVSWKARRQRESKRHFLNTR